MDLKLIETGNGGDLLLLGQDLATTPGLETAVYLSHFGGSSFWANDLIDDPAQRFESITEQVLQQVALNSAGRIQIEQAIIKDLGWTKALAGTKVTVTTAIAATDRLEILINIDGQQFAYLWNPGTEYLTYRV